MATLSPAVSISYLRSKFDELNISPRFTRALLRDSEFQKLLYKNHQLCYLNEFLKKFDDVKLSYNQLAFIFDMNRRTVAKSIAKGPQNPKPKGRHLAFDENTENQILDEIIRRSNIGQSITQGEILTYIKENHDKSVMKGWLNQFYLRHRDKIKKARSFPQEDLRMSVPRAYLKQHIINMHKHLEGRFSELTFNLDEVGSSEWEDRKPKKVFVDANLDSNHITHLVSRKIPHMTLLTCVSAAGDSLTPLLITKHELNEKFWETGIRPDEDVMARVRDPPYISKELFLEYLDIVLLPYITAVREKLRIEEKESILLMDSCTAHCDDSIKEILGKNNILIMTYPSHTTNLFQALDLSLFGVFKRNKNKLDTETTNKSLEETAINVIKAYEQIATIFNILGSFKRAGIGQDMNSNPKRIKIDVEQIVTNPGFKELWNMNIKIEDISKRRQNHVFGIININSLPDSCTIFTNNDSLYEKDEEIEQYFK